MVSSSAPPLVLVADDEPSMLELVARHLRSYEYPELDVIEASDGDEAWRLAKERLPDLVVLDVMMPGMSGWEVCRKIREDVALAHTGVVMLTGIGENLNQMTSPLYGADAYLDKPFEFEELDEKVKNALDARASQRDLVPRPAYKNGVGGPARAASPGVRKAGSKKAGAKKAGSKKVSAKSAGSKVGAKKARSKTTGTKKFTSKKKHKAVGSLKGQIKMAAKKTAKKAASKKSPAKKAAKKKTTAKKAAKKK